MLQIPIKQHLDEAYNFYHSNLNDEKISKSLRKGVFEVAEIAVSYARKMTGYANVKVRIIEDYNATYKGSYDFRPEVPVITLNIASFAIKISSLLQLGSTSNEIESFTFSCILATMLHELGHHHEAVTVPTFIQDLNDFEFGGLAVDYINQLSSSNRLPNPDVLLNDNKFIEILTDSKDYIVRGERSADQYVINILNKYHMTDVLMHIKSDGFDIKDGYYYRIYSDEFLEQFSENLFLTLFQNEQSKFQTFLDKIIHLTDEVILSRLRNARRKKLNY